MNILPKKRWHVRTKENIARVRKDEAEAAEKEKQEKLRIETADREARLRILKHKSKQRLLDADVPEAVENKDENKSAHINLFENFDNAVKTVNKDHEHDAKQKKEEYEKQIGYLTYLGQDTNEALKKKNWYEVAPESSRFSRSNEIKDTYNKLVLRDEDGKPKIGKADIRNGEIEWKSKQRYDPLSTIRKQINMKPKKIESLLKTKEICESKDKHSKLSKIEKLRNARLKREQQEKRKTELFLKSLHGESKTSQSNNAVDNKNKLVPKYNSQFNPELARQNYR